MEGLSLQSLTLNTIPSSLSQTGFTEKPSSSVHVKAKVPKFVDPIRYPYSRIGKLKFCSRTRAQASGTKRSGSDAVQSIIEKVNSKDDNLVFVAGATGRVGSRTVRELLKLGFQVRAGVRNAQKADALVQSVKQMKPEMEIDGNESVKRLEIVECDLEKQDQIALALGNASVVICCIGASEKEVFDITGPYRIDYQATKNLIDAATIVKVNHFILLTSLGTNKIGFPAAILNLFWGVLIWKRKAEEALLASGLPYTIVRPGGMERPTDAYKETHNITLSTEDTLFGGQVSNLQVAELMAVMAKNLDLSCCKVVEVVAETTAPLTPMEELLGRIPSQRPTCSPKKPDVAIIPDSVPSDGILPVEPKISVEVEPAQSKTVQKPALSPYAVYEDLKPPSSPSPSQPGGWEDINVIDPVPKSSASDAQIVISGISVISEPKSAPEEPKARSSSPYAGFDDLKPPSSPAPSQPGIQKGTNDSATLPKSSSLDIQIGTSELPGISETKSAPGGPRIERLSPYVAYEDLKPPSSPSPTPSGSKERPLTASATVESPTPPTSDIVPERTTPGSTVGNDFSQNTVHYHSPYPVYSDFKPPTSPCPSAPSASSSISVVNDGSKLGTLSGNNSPQLQVAVTPKEHIDPKATPLSPFTMYEDLIPPSSPTPSSPRKF